MPFSGENYSNFTATVVTKFVLTLWWIFTHLVMQLWIFFMETWTFLLYLSTGYCLVFLPQLLAFRLDSSVVFWRNHSHFRENISGSAELLANISHSFLRWINVLLFLILHNVRMNSYHLSSYVYCIGPNNNPLFASIATVARDLSSIKLYASVTMLTEKG